MSDRFNIQYSDENGAHGQGRLDQLPETCPQCCNKIDPKVFVSFYNSNKKVSSCALEVIFRCPHLSCHEVFIGYYSLSLEGRMYNFYLKKTDPTRFAERLFPENIKGISTEFAKIYNQAKAAEVRELDQICGPGYRKALEFLIKDYLLKKTQDEVEKEKIKHEQLGEAIKNRIEDVKIKEVAKRAAWLGNDETHFMRKWVGQDLETLKKLIDLTVHWMEAEALTAQLLQDMPEKTIIK